MDKFLKLFAILIIFFIFLAIGGFLQTNEVHLGNITLGVTESETNELFQGSSFDYDSASDLVIGLKVESINNDETSTSYGSAVLIEKEITTYTAITNKHVIENASSITVAFPDENDDFVYLTATEVYSDENYDLALIEFTYALDLPIAQLSETVEISDEAFAIGTSINLNYYNTLNEGIVSQVDRSIDVSDASFIQHTAALNNGNSGGGLFNSNGHLIGINTLKLTAGTDTLYFAIDVETINTFLDSRVIT